MATDNNIRRELKEISLPLADLPAATPFSLPSGYFEGLAEQVMRRIRTEDAQTPAEEISILSPLLGGLKHKPTFTMPAGYLDELTTKTLAATDKKMESKVVPMFFRSPRIRYAVAAVVTGLLLAGAWFFTTQKQTNVSIAQTNEATIEKQIQAQANKVSDTEMLNYLNGNVSLWGMEAANSTGEIRQDDIKDLLADVSDQELEHFLNYDDPRAEKLN